MRGRDWLAALPSIAVAVVVGALLWDTFLGDPSIYLPFARNLAHGQFFRFNPHGEFSTGIASPVWTVLLAVPFTLGLGVMSVKVLALVATVAALVVAAAAARRVSGSVVASAIAVLFVVTHLAYWGDTAYDSGVAVILSAATVLAGRRLQRTRPLAARDVWPLAIVWGLLPLGRADLAVLIPLQALALWLGGVVRTRAELKTVLGPVLLALLPALAYYAAAFVDTGSYSVSSATRTYDQKLGAKELGPLLYSSEALAFLRSISYAIVAALAGSALLARERTTRWVGVYCASGIVVYALVIVFFPVTFYEERYWLPATPLAAVGIASALVALSPLRRPAAALAFAAVLVLSLVAVKGPFATAGDQRDRRYSFDEITEKRAAQKINAIAPKGATVLGYEVQDRWQLRDDLRLLALNGITDGHVFGYRDRGDMRGFLRAYRPRYWLANDPVKTLPYLRDSLLGDAYTRLQKGETDFVIDQVGFRLVDKRDTPVPAGFAGWRYLVQIDAG